MDEFIKRNSPPGMDTKFEKRFVLAGWLLSFAYSLLFLGAYFTAWSELYVWSKDKRVLVAGRMMPDFAELIDTYLIGFAIVALCMIAFIIHRYTYYRQGSMSIYLMKRLPHRSERHRRAWLLPMLVMLFCAVFAFALLMIYFAIYMLVTPAECVATGQWYKLWRF